VLRGGALRVRAEALFLKRRFAAAVDDWRALVAVLATAGPGALAELLAARVRLAECLLALGRYEEVMEGCKSIVDAVPESLGKAAGKRMLANSASSYSLARDAVLLGSSGNLLDDSLTATGHESLSAHSAVAPELQRDVARSGTLAHSMVRALNMRAVVALRIVAASGGGDTGPNASIAHLNAPALPSQPHAQTSADAGDVDTPKLNAEDGTTEGNDANAVAAAATAAVMVDQNKLRDRLFFFFFFPPLFFDYYVFHTHSHSKLSSHSPHRKLLGIALTDLQQLLAMTPDDNSARALMGKTLSMMGLYDAALREYNRVARLERGSGTATRGVHVAMAICCLRMGDIPEAMKALTSGLHADPGDKLRGGYMYFKFVSF
jgi:tetratricopeptide (TPR) repeat protein